MTRMRERAKVCERCMTAVKARANIDMKAVVDVQLPVACFRRSECWRELSHNIFDEQFDEGMRHHG